jgi:hypothetical protein
MSPVFTVLAASVTTFAAPLSSPQRPNRLSWINIVSVRAQLRHTVNRQDLKKAGVPFKPIQTSADFRSVRIEPWELMLHRDGARR